MSNADREPAFISKFFVFQQYLLALKLIKEDFAFIKSEDIYIIKHLGSGNFGSVSLCDIHDEKCAIKDFHEESPNKYKLDLIESLYREIHAGRKATHPNVVPIQGFSLDPFSVITRYIDGESLDSFIFNKIKYATLDRTRKFSIAYGIANGLDWISKISGVIHRDLKPDNILLDGNLNPFIADFGIVDILTGSEKDKEFEAIGNRLHQPPECLAGGTTDKSAAVYAYGLILYAIMTGERPYVGIDKISKFKQLRKFVCVQKKHPTFPEHTPNNIQEIIKKCISYEPSNRPSFSAIKAELWKIFIEEEIPSEQPRAFWNNNFTGVFEVRLKDIPDFNCTIKMAKCLCGPSCTITPARFNELYRLYRNWYEPGPGFKEASDLINAEWFLEDPDGSVETALRGCEDKTFFVRTSTSREDSPFSLAVSDNKNVTKYYVQRTEDGYICGEVPGDTVNAIIETTIGKGIIGHPYKSVKGGYGKQFTSDTSN